VEISVKLHPDSHWRGILVIRLRDGGEAVRIKKGYAEIRGGESAYSVVIKSHFRYRRERKGVAQRFREIIGGVVSRKAPRINRGKTT